MGLKPTSLGKMKGNQEAGKILTKNMYAFSLTFTPSLIQIPTNGVIMFSFTSPFSAQLQLQLLPILTSKFPFKQLFFPLKLKGFSKFKDTHFDNTDIATSIQGQELGAKVGLLTVNGEGQVLRTRTSLLPQSQKKKKKNLHTKNGMTNSKAYHISQKPRFSCFYSNHPRCYI